MARFYPLVQQARSLLHEGSLGEIWNVHGSYLQDWLLRPTDWNWRLEPERGGELRAIGDIGSHWLDIVQFVTGSRIVEVFADLQTVIPIRRRPVAGGLGRNVRGDSVAELRPQPGSLAPHLADDRLRAGGPRLPRSDLPRPRRGLGDRPRRFVPQWRSFARDRLAGLPGLGEVRWDRFLAALYAVGYDHVVSIEHEDRALEGDDELVKRGFLIARNALRPYIA
jgi:Oxidoreductase family, C-terminal alpha/beta domain